MASDSSSVVKHGTMTYIMGAQTIKEGGFSAEVQSELRSQSGEGK